MGRDSWGSINSKQQLGQGDTKEIILATSATVEGDITAQYIADLATGYAGEMQSACPWHTAGRGA